MEEAVAEGVAMRPVYDALVFWKAVAAEPLQEVEEERSLVVMVLAGLGECGWARVVEWVAVGALEEEEEEPAVAVGFAGAVEPHGAAARLSGKLASVGEADFFGLALRVTCFSV